MSVLGVGWGVSIPEGIGILGRLVSKMRIGIPDDDRYAMV